MLSPATSLEMRTVSPVTTLAASVAMRTSILPVVLSTDGETALTKPASLPSMVTSVPTGRSWRSASETYVTISLLLALVISITVTKLPTKSPGRISTLLTVPLIGVRRIVLARFACAARSAPSACFTCASAVETALPLAASSARDTASSADSMPAIAASISWVTPISDARRLVNEVRKPWSSASL
jgi:hypothetical protein